MADTFSVTVRVDCEIDGEANLKQAKEFLAENIKIEMEKVLNEDETFGVFINGWEIIEEAKNG